MGDTIPGGYHYNSDRKRHEDAWGNPVEKQSDAAVKKAKDEAADLTADQSELLAQQARSTRAAQEARAAADAAEAQARTARAAPKPRAKAGKKK